MRKFRSHRTKKSPISHINVTPFVDVMLVLLVIFMLIAPALNVGVPVKLPKGSGAQISGGDQPIIITVNNNGDIFLGEAAVSLTELNNRLDQLAEINKDRKIFVRGDENTPYGNIMAVMNAVSEKGLGRVSLITESRGR
ncbi:MAG: ExbD/TolR family protein [Alphaproteobacteria bacterium]